MNEVGKRLVWRLEKALEVINVQPCDQRQVHLSCLAEDDVVSDHRRDIHESDVVTRQLLHDEAAHRIPDFLLRIFVVNTKVGNELEELDFQVLGDA